MKLPEWSEQKRAEEIALAKTRAQEIALAIQATLTRRTSWTVIRHAGQEYRARGWEAVWLKLTELQKLSVPVVRPEIVPQPYASAAPVNAAAEMAKIAAAIGASFSISGLWIVIAHAGQEYRLYGWDAAYDMLKELQEQTVSDAIKPVKYTSFEAIPRFTRCGQWEADFRLDRVVHNVDEWVSADRLDLNPDFQRGHVWTVEQKRSYMEFFLRGGITARVLYFNNPSWRNKATTDYKDFVIVDGLQRLSAIRDFIENRLAVFGSYYREYTDSTCLCSTIRINVNDLQTRVEVLQWYLDFNSGGTVHSADELIRVRALLADERSREGCHG